MKTLAEKKQTWMNEIRKTNSFKRMIASPYFDSEHSWWNAAGEQVNLSWNEKIELVGEFENEDFKECRLKLEEEIKAVKRIGYTNGVDYKEIPDVENIEELVKISPVLKNDMETIKNNSWKKTSFNDFIDNVQDI